MQKADADMTVSFRFHIHFSIRKPKQQTDHLYAITFAISHRSSCIFCVFWRKWYTTCAHDEFMPATPENFFISDNDNDNDGNGNGSQNKARMFLSLFFLSFFILFYFICIYMAWMRFLNADEKPKCPRLVRIVKRSKYCGRHFTLFEIENACIIMSLSSTIHPSPNAI